MPRGALDYLPDIGDPARALVVTCDAVLPLSIRKFMTHELESSDIQGQVNETLHTLREVLRTLS